ncbi:unnamed protein product, partial [Brassica rapa subsp. trilocularis]
SFDTVKSSGKAPPVSSPVTSLRGEEIADGDGEDIGARDGVGTGELESGFGRITTSNLSLGRRELGKFNPSEHKQLKLAKSLDRGIIDRDLKPSNNEQKSIQRVLKYPPTKTLSGDERQSFFALWSGVMFRMFQTMLAYFLMMARDFTNQSVS